MDTSCVATIRYKQLRHFQIQRNPNKLDKAERERERERAIIASKRNRSKLFQNEPFCNMEITVEIRLIEKLWLPKAIADKIFPLAGRNPRIPASNYCRDRRLLFEEQRAEQLTSLRNRNFNLPWSFWTCHDFHCVKGHVASCIFWTRGHSLSTSIFVCCIPVAGVVACLFIRVE